VVKRRNACGTTVLFDRKRQTFMIKGISNPQTLSGVINRRNGFSENLFKKGFIEND
jgi:hypothetical protein